MHGVVLTSIFEKQARAAGLTEDEIMAIATSVAAEPLAGAIIAGTGGARKLRHAGRGKGKSGGYRTIHYFAGEDIPVFLLAIYGKGEKGNLTMAEKNDLAALLPRIAEAYKPRKRQ